MRSLILELRSVLEKKFTIYKTIRKMSTIFWIISIGLASAVLLAIMIWIIPSKKLLIVEKWIKAYKGNSSGST